MLPLAIIGRDPARAFELLVPLEEAGFRAAIFTASRPALPLLRDRRFALALLDLWVADADPFELCRDTSPIVPVIALVHGRCGEEPCTQALESGADDCLCRGFTHRELIARIRNVLRRAGEKPSPQLAAAVSEMRIRLDGHVENLTAGETAVLAALLDHAPRPMTTDEIARATGATRGTIESRIKSLRRKLGTERLVSRGRFGYQLE